jgi:chloramphenicol 3-O-phosphotransferase
MRRSDSTIDNRQMTAATILIGAPGSGKSSVLDALATRLEIDGVAHGAIESEQLARGFPLLQGSSWTEQLAAVLKLQRDAGRELFLISATPESDEELRAVVAAASSERRLVVCLSAPVEVLAGRLQRREPDRWPGKARLIAHARTLATMIPRLDGVDLMLDTSGRDAEAVAGEVYARMRLGGLCVTR